MKRAAAIGVALLAAVATRPARGDEPAPPQAATAPIELDPAAYAELSDEELLAMAEAQGAEVIVVWDERAEKPFDRDTTLRLSEEDLAAKGATDLADALADLPDVVVRILGRGGQQIDIRGARKAGVKILVDGAGLADPFYGTFDLTSIAVTDIVQVRVSTSPASPIDGPGGPGGVVEVHTRDAIGARAIVAQATGDTLPTAAAAATGRAALADAVAVRVSATGTLGADEYQVPDGTVDGGRQVVGGATRLEWRRPGQTDRRAVLDLSAQTRAFVVPPSEEDVGMILRINQESALRGGARYEDRLGAVRIATSLHGYLQQRDAAYYADPEMTEVTDHEDLTARRLGASLLANRPVGRDLQLVAAAHLDTEDARVDEGDGAITEGRSTIGELAAGAQWQRGGFRLDAAGGVAVPLGVGETPWPEGKLTAQASPVPMVTFTATLGRKGRLPTLRERYRVDVGNTALDPELASFAEARVAIAPRDTLRFEAASWVRRQSGMILLDRDTNALENVGVLDLRGIDAVIAASPSPRFETQLSWSFTEASDESSADPLDFLPRHRAMATARVSPIERASLGTRLVWISEQIDRDTTIPAHAEWELEAVVKPVAGWLAAARLDDVLDRRWPLRPGVPSAGRTLTLTVQATFE